MPRSGRRKGGSYLEFTKEQKSEYRRLVQNANRRVTRATEAYEREGMDVPPSFLVGGKQDRSEWYSKTMAFSRSMDFKTEKEYKKALEFFKSFDPKTSGQQEKRPTMTEYKKRQVERTVQAMQNILGAELNIKERDRKGKLVYVFDFRDKLEKMSAPQLTKFWAAFSKKASRMGMKYSSNDAMRETMQEFFEDDFKQFNDLKWEQDMIADYKRDMGLKRVL